MPTYQYACTECAHRFEAVQSFSDASLTECPQCAGRLRKVFSSVGVVFKGSGFYRNDSRATGNGSSDSSSKASSDSSSSESTSTSSTSDGSATSSSSSSTSSDSSSKSSAPASAAS